MTAGVARTLPAAPRSFAEVSHSFAASYGVQQQLSGCDQLALSPSFSAVLSLSFQFGQFAIRQG